MRALLWTQRRLNGLRAVHLAPAQDDNPALFDWGTFVNGGTPDPTWVRPLRLPASLSNTASHTGTALAAALT